LTGHLTKASHFRTSRSSRSYGRIGKLGAVLFATFAIWQERKDPR